MRLQERPLDAVDAADAERRELFERGGREVDAADRAAWTGVRDGDGDGLVAVGHAHLAAAHGVPGEYTYDVSVVFKDHTPARGEEEAGCLRVGVRTCTREGGDGGVVDGDNVVGGGVVLAAGSESGGVEGSCLIKA